MPASPKFCIFGGGAIGGMVATLLARSGATVSVVARWQQDYVIIAVKAPSLSDIARRIGPLLGPETAVVTAMNGVPWWFFLNAKGVLAGHQLKAIDPDGAIGQAIAIRRVIGCVLYVAASVDEAGIIRHSSGGQLLVGEPDNQLTPRLALKEA